MIIGSSLLTGNRNSSLSSDVFCSPTAEPQQQAQGTKNYSVASSNGTNRDGLKSDFYKKNTIKKFIFFQNLSLTTNDGKNEKKNISNTGEKKHVLNARKKRVFFSFFMHCI